MITSAKEAKQITDPNGTFSNDDPVRLRAEDYLVALQGSEVKALAEVITKASLEIGQSSREPDKMLCVKGWLDSALAKYREAIK